MCLAQETLLTLLLVLGWLLQVLARMPPILALLAPVLFLTMAIETDGKLYRVKVTQDELKFMNKFDDDQSRVARSKPHDIEHFIHRRIEIPVGEESKGVASRTRFASECW